ncbi:MAG: chemotaxis protein CheW, partial [Candidatus Omnitrophica bacterium]|nr:chemotaxis protein CheW [Candidatus Omnitrophota bacterium]
MSAEAERVPPGGEAEEILPVEEPTESLITLRLGTEWYGLPIAKARTVVRVGHVTPLPSVPPHVIGIVNLRGEVLSVTDLRRLFGLPPAPITVDSRLVIVE